MAGQGMQLAGNIFNDMVMQEAIKDKTVEVQKQMIDEATGEHVAGFNQGMEEDKDDKDSDSDFNSDGDDNLMMKLREQKIMDMKARANEKQEDLAKGHGQYTEITEEQFLPIVTKSKFVVCHFYHKDFERCKIVDHHLSMIAKKHTETKFVYIDAEKCPFFIAKLQVQVLPTMIGFMDGISIDRIVGFEELGGQDEFPTMLLIRRLVNGGMIKALNNVERGQMKMKRKGGRRDESDSDEGNDDY